MTVRIAYGEEVTVGESSGYNTGSPTAKRHGQRRGDTMLTQHTLLIIIRLLEECLEQEYTREELLSKIRDVLRLLGV